MKRLVAAWLAIVLATAPAALASSSATVRGTVRIIPITVSLSVDPSSAAVGAPVHARAIVTNGSASPADVRVELRFDPVGLVVKSESKTSFQIRPGRSTTVSWSLCGRVAGSYVVLAGAAVGDAFVDSPARLLTIQPGKKATCK